MSNLTGLLRKPPKVLVCSANACYPAQTAVSKATFFVFLSIFISIAVIKYHGSSNLRKKGFILAYSSRGTQSILVRNEATGKESVEAYTGSWLMPPHLHTQSNAKSASGARPMVPKACPQCHTNSSKVL